MNIAFYNAFTAMQAYQKSLDVVSNNLANVSTNGYKEVKSTFNDLLYTKLNQNGDHNMLVGHGVKLGSVDKKFEQGMLQSTNYELDFAILGEGFFATQINEDGDIAYTRDGAFRLGEEDGVFYLTRTDGSFVLDSELQRIEIAYDKDTKLANLEGIGKKIGIFNFNNPYELVKGSNNTYLESERSGEAILASESKSNTLIQGALEGSTANMTDGMVAMMESQRAFQLNARLVQTADQIEEMVNNLR